MIKLSELRNEKGLTQREIAKIFNVSQGTYNNWENGKTQPSIEQLVAIADFFGLASTILSGERAKTALSQARRTTESIFRTSRATLFTSF